MHEGKRENWSMILLTLEYVPNKEIDVIGMVKGTTVRSVHAGKDILSSFKTLIGGELPSYTGMMDSARSEATARMVVEAIEMGADAIIGIRYGASGIVDGAAEILAYGTAVKFLEEEEEFYEEAEVGVESEEEEIKELQPQEVDAEEIESEEEE